MSTETRRQFEVWAGSYELGLKPVRCTTEEFEYCEIDMDFAWQAWKAQTDAIEQMRNRLAVMEKENGMLKNEAAKAFASRIAERHLILHALRDAERYRYLREHSDMFSRSPEAKCQTPHEVDVLVDFARFGKIDT